MDSEIGGGGGGLQSEGAGADASGTTCREGPGEDETSPRQLERREGLTRLVT